MLPAEVLQQVAAADASGNRKAQESKGGHIIKQSSGDAEVVDFEDKTASDDETNQMNGYSDDLEGEDEVRVPAEWLTVLGLVTNCIEEFAVESAMQEDGVANNIGLGLSGAQNARKTSFSSESDDSRSEASDDDDDDALGSGENSGVQAVVLREQAMLQAAG
eukprot:SAG31_NODE_4308_length_3369_cov_2.531804_2_plen_162_part_00